MDGDELDELLKLNPKAYPGDRQLDSGSFAAGTSNTPEPESERWLLEMSNDQYLARHPWLHTPGTVVPGGAVDLVNALPAHVTGRRQGEPPPLRRHPVPGAGTTDLAHELTRPMSVAERQELAKQMPSIWETANPDVGLHPELDGQTGDPSTELLGPEGW